MKNYNKSAVFTIGFRLFPGLFAVRKSICYNTGIRGYRFYRKGMHPMSYYISLDGGGTKTEAVVFDETGHIFLRDVTHGCAGV